MSGQPTAAKPGCPARGGRAERLHPAAEHCAGDAEAGERSAGADAEHPGEVIRRRCEVERGQGENEEDAVSVGAEHACQPVRVHPAERLGQHVDDAEGDRADADEHDRGHRRATELGGQQRREHDEQDDGGDGACRRHAHAPLGGAARLARPAGRKRFGHEAHDRTLLADHADEHRDERGAEEEHVGAELAGREQPREQHVRDQAYRDDRDARSCGPEQPGKKAAAKTPLRPALVRIAMRDRPRCQVSASISLRSG
jgi:hypothetical protein